MYVTPVVTGDTVLLGSCSGSYFALDATDGSVRWRYDTRQDGGPPRNFHGDPLVAGETVITPADAIDDRGGVYAFALADGSLRWHAAVGNIETDLIRHGDLAIGGTTRGGLVALDLADGSPAWRFELLGEPSQNVRTMAPAFDEGTVFLGGRDGTAYAIGAGKGDIRWRTELGCHASTRAVVDKSHLWLGCADGQLLRLARNDGAVERRLDLGGWPHHGLTRVEDGLIVLINADTIAFVDAGLEAVRWRQTADQEWSSFRPLLLGDQVLLGNGQGELVAIDLATGTPVWQRHLGGVLRGIGRHGATLYVGSLRGSLTAFEPEALRGLAGH